MKIGILNYEACNIASIYYSLYRLGYDPIVLNKPGVINKLDKLIIPGVGAAKKCMDFMNSSSIKDEIINFFDKGKPILGICLGLQIFSKKLYENGESDGLGLIDAKVVPLDGKKINMGWSNITVNNNSNFCKIFNNKSFYFCHSYYLKMKDDYQNINCKAYLDEKNKIPSVVINKNFIGSQFHPEKSQKNGVEFLKKFMCWEPN